ncbi:MAG: hypothetical protein ABI556_09615 [Gemmatimonadales bacterium]
MADGDGEVVTPKRRPLPAAATAIARAGEPLWVASLAALFVVWGYDLIPKLIRLLGRAGQTETVEWAVYMSLLTAFPLAVLIIGLVVPRVLGVYAQTIVKASAVVFALWIALLFLVQGRMDLLLLAFIPAVATVVDEAKPLQGFQISRSESLGLLLFVLVAIIAWTFAGSLVYWEGGKTWFVAGARQIIAVLIALFLVFLGVPRLGIREGTLRSARRWSRSVERVLTAVALIGLVAFSFRTNPMVEFYHWGFWTGPIEQLRQGGWLLRDTPSQYGFLSILIPTAFPGSSWQSFWFYQSLVYAIVAITMFIVLRRMKSGIGNLLLSAGVVFTTLFFRPRAADLILPAQMTPSGGPVRFLWCFVMLVYLLWAFDSQRGEKARPGRIGFPVTGHLIWLTSLAWSFESAIYCTAIWFPAFLAFLIQKAASEKASHMSKSSIVRRFVISSAIPFVMALVLYMIVWIIYRLSIGIGPDMAGYIEYGLLYSRGFGALPIDTTGAVWYLLLVFFITSTVAAALLVENWRDFRFAVAAGIWGGVWSLSSYFVSRSHPANLLSIIPVLLIALAILVVIVRDMPFRPWHSYARVALVPVFTIPFALTLGHPKLGENLGTEQHSPSRFTDQVPLMDQELESLMRESGAEPTDPVVRIADGRLVLPAWRGENGKPIMSETSWLPKPYEIIGTLSPERRQAYIDRDAAKPISGWLIQHQTDTVRWFGDHLKQIQTRHTPTRKFAKGQWSIWWMEPTPSN